jgi:hypothetical protein
MSIMYTPLMYYNINLPFAATYSYVQCILHTVIWWLAVFLPTADT